MPIGEILAIGCALTWSVSVILFKLSSAAISPLHLNLFKNIVGFLLFVPTVYFVDGLLWVDATPSQLWILAVSGAIGIGFADGLALTALKRLGASRFAVVECVYAPSMALMSFWYLGESLATWQLLGGALIIAAVLWINLPKRGFEAVNRRNAVIGTLLGSTAILSMAYGVVLAKPVFSELPLMWLIMYRLGCGMLASFVVTLFVRDRWSGWLPLRDGKTWVTVLVAGMFSTYFSMMMWIAGFAYTATAIAATLNQTATIFTVLLAAAFLKEKLTVRQWVGTMVAFAGVLIVTQTARGG